jgi:hypothetical protein
VNHFQFHAHALSRRINRLHDKLEVPARIGQHEPANALGRARRRHCADGPDRGLRQKQRIVSHVEYALAVAE